MARVALLMLTTGLFAALWSGDQSEQTAAAERTVKMNVSRRISDQMPFETIGHIRQRRAPLPSGIAAGTYLVADQTGQTQIRVVSESETEFTGTNRAASASNHYQVETKTQRWHYIRIVTPDANLTNRSVVGSYR